MSAATDPDKAGGLIDAPSLAYLRHEIRTPLNHIIGYSEMLLEDLAGPGDAALAARLRSVRIDARRVLGKVDQLLGHRDGEAAPFDVDRLAVEMQGPVDALAAGIAALPAEGSDAPGAVMEDVARIRAAEVGLRNWLSAGALRAVSPSALAEVAARAESGAAPAPHSAGRILVVDDDLDNRLVLQRRLQRDGHAVDQAASAREALQALRQKAYDLVLLDLIMPETDGYAALRLIKSDPALAAVAVLMISAVDETDGVSHCIEAGAEDYLPKPFDPIILRARVGASLERKRLRDQEARHVEELERRVAFQVDQLQRLEKLKRFFSPQLAEAIVAGGADDPLRTHRREITVCFLDLRGFTAFAETNEPEEVMAVLHDFHAEMGRLILEHEGTLERFTGDGMMIFFNDPTPVPDAGERAVRMALAMREGVRGLAEQWGKLGYELGLGIGIAQGYATIGAIGFDGRWDYGAIGSVTNLAARLCGEAKAAQILVTQKVQAVTRRVARTAEVGPLVLKGFTRPVMVHALLDLSSEPQSPGA